MKDFKVQVTPPESAELQQLAFEAGYSIKSPKHYEGYPYLLFFQNSVTGTSMDMIDEDLTFAQAKAYLQSLIPKAEHAQKSEPDYKGAFEYAIKEMQKQFVQDVNTEYNQYGKIVMWEFQNFYNQYLKEHK